MINRMNIDAIDAENVCNHKLSLENWNCSRQTCTFRTITIESVDSVNFRNRNRISECI